MKNAELRRTSFSFHFQNKSRSSCGWPFWHAFAIITPSNLRLQQFFLLSPVFAHTQQLALSFFFKSYNACRQRESYYNHQRAALFAAQRIHRGHEQRPFENDPLSTSCLAQNSQNASTLILTDHV